MHVVRVHCRRMSLQPLSIFLQCTLKLSTLRPKMDTGKDRQTRPASPRKHYPCHLPGSPRSRSGLDQSCFSFRPTAALYPFHSEQASICPSAEHLVSLYRCAPISLYPCVRCGVSGISRDPIRGVIGGQLPTPPSKLRWSSMNQR